MTFVQEFLIVGVKHALISQIIVRLETSKFLILKRSKCLTEKLSKERPVVEHLLAFGLSFSLLMVLLFITVSTGVICDPIEWVDTVRLRIEVILEAGHLRFMLSLLIPAGHKAAEVGLPLVLTFCVLLRTTSHIEILRIDVLVVFIGAELWGSVGDELVEHLAW